MSEKRRVLLEERRVEGACRLCGAAGRLTKTHVPARSAGNVGMRQPAVVEIDERGRRTYGLGREVEGGMWGYWFCAPCNNKCARPWDEEFARWVPPIFRAIHDSQSSGNTISANFADLDPGAFARCIWAWFFATVEGLREELPEIAAAVQTGESVRPPTGLPRVYLACTRDLQISTMCGRFSAGITAPPFAAVLASEWTRYLVPSWFDVALWLPQRPGHRRDLAVTLPIVELLGEEGLPMLGQPVLE